MILAYTSMTPWYAMAVFGGVMIAIIVGWGWERERHDV